MTKKTTISPEEAARGIYIDFEGTAIDPPSFLGITWVSGGGNQRFIQIVLEKTLWPADEAKSPRVGGNCFIGEWRDLTVLRKLSEEQGRKIFAWSTHEATSLEEHVSGTDGKWFGENVINAIPIGKAWKRKHHPESVFQKDPKNPWLGKNNLSKYLKLIDYHVPKAFGPGNAAQQSKYVKKMLEKKLGDYSKLTPVAKAKWTKVLKHNWYDCDGLRMLMGHCADNAPQTYRAFKREISQTDESAFDYFSFQDGN